MYISNCTDVQADLLTHLCLHGTLILKGTFLDAAASNFKNLPLSRLIQQTDNIFLIFPRKKALVFHANCLHWRQFA